MYTVMIEYKKLPGQITNIISVFNSIATLRADVTKGFTTIGKITEMK